jgi:HSP20 family protein
MNMRNLIPFARPGRVAPWREEETPIAAFRREMNRMFDAMLADFDASFAGLASADGFGLSAWPRIDLAETDGEIVVTAELPGLAEKDVEVFVDDGALTLRGERQEERRDAERQISERYWGRFERRIALPAEVLPDKVAASMKDGVLTITLPKSPEARQRTRKITVERGK